MSRMDRYDKNKQNEHSAQEKTSFFARRERKAKEENTSDSFDQEYEENETYYENTYEDTEYSNYNTEYTNDMNEDDSYSETPYMDDASYTRTRNKESAKKAVHPKGPKQKKKRKKRSWKRKLLYFFLFLLAFIFGSFFLGKTMAQHDDSLPAEEVETFNGSSTLDGSKNILLLGSDTRGEDAGRADTIMVLHLGGIGSKPKLVSFMRDSFVSIPGVGQNKINAAYAYGGADLVRQTLSENFGIECQYYAKVDFQSFEKVVDALFANGVEIDAEKDLNLDGVDIKQGEQKMDGHTLLQYARFRKDEEGDFGRVRRQQQTMNAIFSQLKNPLNLIRAPYAAGKAFGYISTDLPSTFFLTNGLSLVGAASGVDRLSVPVDNSWSNGSSSYAGSILVIDTQT
ncbi:MAG: LCP family protein, partial [Enterococcus sp.]